MPWGFFLLGGNVGLGVHQLAAQLAQRYALAPKFDSRHRALLLVALGAIAFAGLEFRFGIQTQTLLLALHTVILLIVLIIDLEHWLILNAVIVPAIVFAIVASPISAIGVASSIAGGAAALAIALIMYGLGQIHARVRKSNAITFGQGDIKLAAYIGLVVGFPAAVFAMILTVFLSGIGALIYLACQLAVRRRLALQDVIPYAPYFCIAAWLTMLF